MNRHIFLSPHVTYFRLTSSKVSVNAGLRLGWVGGQIPGDSFTMRIWSETEDVVDLNLQPNGAAKNCWEVVLTLANDVLFNDRHGAELELL